MASLCKTVTCPKTKVGGRLCNHVFALKLELKLVEALKCWLHLPSVSSVAGTILPYQCEPTTLATSLDGLATLSSSLDINLLDTVRCRRCEHVDE